MISLIMMTYRPGGLDVFAQSFAGVDADYELIVVDDYPGRVGRGEAQRFLKNRGIKLGWYGGSKHKSYFDTKGGLCNAMNTALLHVRGNYTVWVSDYTVLPSCWPLQWLTVPQQAAKVIGHDRLLISGGGIVYYAQKPGKPGDVTTWDKAVQPVPKWPWVPREFETFYFGAPLKFFLEINGVDERADHCHCWPVSSKIAQAKLLGYELLVEPSTACHMIDHRPWDSPDEPNPVGGEGLWRITHARSAPEEPEWTVPSPNPFNLKEERRKILCDL